MIENEIAVTLIPSTAIDEKQPHEPNITNIITPKCEYLNIPEELRQKNQWVAHRNKVPFNVKTRREDRNIPAEWATFEEAHSAAGKYDGLGFRFNNNGIVGVDIDTCINPETGQISDEALHIINTLDSYTEISPSGYGVHIFVRADILLPFHKKSMKPNGIVRVVHDKQKTPELEIYNNGRYFTMTGKVYGASKMVAERNQELQSIIDLYDTKTEHLNPSPTNNLILDIMFNSKKGDKYKALYDGNTSEYRSHSEADQALCNILCYFTKGDKSVIDSLFRQSGLMRPKWDEKHGADTYGNLTIQKAVNIVKDDYASQQMNAPVISALPEWELPLPFKSVDLPSFPVDELPFFIGDYVRAVAETTQTSPDMAAVASLAILALCLQSKFVIEGKKDWREPLNLYTLIIAPPAERKSAIMALLSEPVKRFEDEENERLATYIEQNKIEKAILMNRKKSLESKYSKTACVNHEAIREISRQISEFKEIKPCRLFCDDITPEKLSGILSDNDGKTAIMSTEGGIFDVLAGRYSGSANIDVFLKAHSGDSIRVDRQGRQSEYIKNPALTTLIFSQPSVMTSLISNSTFHGRGLCARFLYSIPTSTVGSRKFESKPISEVTASQYYKLIGTLLKYETDNPKVIRLSDKSYQLLKEFAEKIEPMLIDELADISDLAGKFVGSVLRIAGLIYVAQCVPLYHTDEPVLDECYMQSAIIIGEYFLEHAKAAYQLMGADKVIENCKYILKQLQKSKPQIITSRDIMRTCRKFKTADETLIPLNRLCEYGYLRELKTKTWEVNPATYELKI